MVNVQLLIAAAVAIAAVTLHVYTFEVWIWPKLRDEGFPTTPFGAPSVTKGFYRTVWHFFTVNWLITIVTNIGVAFGSLIPYGFLLVKFLIIFWVLIVVEIFVVAALSLKPGESYIKTMAKAFQWVIVLIMVFFMYTGTRGG
jgi:FtsH-binding integral membrane protein